ncbi:MAG: SUMF1/EgtB/PvdO family nonheme iron enzyme [Planctomycetes bacterium]|nr:SUMF1/EgtB/PvdO family nonheme iron enzyme [Planctomycetota bacterium]
MIDEADEGQLTELVDEYLQQAGRGTAPDFERFVSRNPKLAPALRILLPALSSARDAATVAEEETQEFPDRLGQYRLLRKIAGGGMGTVYEALHLALNRHVAVKMSRKRVSRPREAQLHFAREMQLLAQTGHPNVVAAFDGGVVDGRPYLVMERLRGEDARRHVERAGPMSVARACDVVRQAAAGLRHVHELGILHRDIKPSNLFLEESGQVKVLDLGLAASARLEAEDDASGEGNPLGTLDYMAPEQAMNPPRADERTDVFGLGCTLYYLVAGRTLFRRAALQDVAGPNAAPAEFAGGLPEPLRELILRMTNVDPAERPQTMAEVAIALAGVEATGDASWTAAASTRASAATPTRASRPKWRLAVFAMVVACGAAWWSANNGRAPASFGRIKPATADLPAGNEPSAFTDQTGTSLVLIPAGSFRMGLEPEPYARLSATPRGNQRRELLLSETPAREVCITKPFYLAAHEATVEEFRRFVYETQYLTQAEAGAPGGMGWDHERGAPAVGTQYHWRNPGWTQSPRDPVVNVSWFDAVRFCEWKSLREGAKYRLPTEAEWEYACCLTSLDERLRRQAPTANIGEGNTSLDGGVPPDGFTFTSPVASFAPNKFGLHDMIGNVWEWCQDWHAASYDSEQIVDPQGPDAGIKRAARGGSWNSTAIEARPTSRAGAAKPQACSYGLGFRVLREIARPTAERAAAL